MTRRLDCTVHGDLPLRVLRGECGAGEEAEARRCPGCRAVLDGIGSLPWAADVAAGVAEGLRLPVQQRVHRRWTGALAVAAALAVAMVLAVVPHHGHRATHRAAASEVVHHLFGAQHSAVGDLNHDGRVDAADLAISLQHPSS